MASFAVPCPKTAALLGASGQSNPSQPRQLPPLSVSFRSDSRSAPALLSRFQGSGRKQADVFKACVQLNEIEKSANSVPANGKKPVEESNSREENEIPDAESIQEFMTQAADLVELVDATDIVELKLKQMGCEILIRKKEALQPPPQPPAAAPVFMPSFHPQAVAQPPAAPAPAETAGSAAPVVPALPAPAAAAPSKSKSSHSPLKSPIAGTFYRAPAPDAPPFVKVGDKVQKGQVVCIVEAMKLMNEIEADKSGTVVEILLENATPVSVGMPLLVIQP